MLRNEGSRALRLAAVAALVAGPALAPLAAGAQTTGSATPQVTVTDEKVRDRVTIDFPDSAFEEERQISRIVQELYGEGADMSSGRSAPADIEALLVTGQPLPARADAQPVDPKLAARLPQDATWLAVGENLVAVGADQRISRVYHDMLP
ncbi:MAG: hypothetical protein CML46_21895 [Rhodobacteraceae bacterium]|nr:hypothetical protein [Paracoccaceae bacterium]MBR26711.1 hypothetical protein [Paracoccaceae bacterium]MBR29561.1 hypothetical protein [Paracoccaceae bacterium]